MTTRFVQFILLFGVVACGPKKDTREAELLTLLKEGEYNVDVTDKVTIPRRTRELMQKYQMAMQKNPDWFLEAQKTVQETGKPIQYDERLGMTKEEYIEFMESMENSNEMEMIKSGTETVSIKHVDGKISFKSSGALDVLNEVTIDESGESANIGKFRLAQVDTVKVFDDKNGLKSKWRGLTWTYEKANKARKSLETQKDYQDLNVKTYKVTLGLLERNKKVYMQIQKSEIVNGQQKMDIKLPFIFQ